MLERRDFIKMGLLGGAALLAYQTIDWKLDTAVTIDQLNENDPGYKVLRRDDVVFFAALIPVFIPHSVEGAVAIDDIMAEIDETFFRMNDSAWRQLYQLTDLLNMPVVRRLLGAPSPQWQHVSPQEATEFLDDWGSSRIAVKKSAYASITSLINLILYSHRGNRHWTDYPGPPLKINAA